MHTQLLDPRANISYDQNKLSQMLTTSPKSIPKWLNDTILVELRPLFLRTRNLDYKNEILEEFINRQHAQELAKHYRTTWSDWRCTLWKNVRDRFTLLHRKDRNLSAADIGTKLENRHISEIFRTWFSATQGNPSDEALDALRNVLLQGFRYLKQFDNENDAHPYFFDESNDLHTINLDFRCKSGMNIASSLNLPEYVPSDDELSNNDGEQSTKRGSDEDGSPQIHIRKRRRRTKSF